jgi:hypothetical protein
LCGREAIKKKQGEQKMSRIPLSVSSDYLPAWGVYEGLRELTQNYIDSQDDCGHAGEIKFIGGLAKGKVIMVNHGARPLNRDALLFGVTSKANREDQRGQFGEGMKVGTLALVRAGRAVTIRTQTETWTASLSPSKEFGGRSVLTFDTRKRAGESDSVEVEIDYVTRDEWDTIRNAFMFMQGSANSLSGDYGSLLLDHKHKHTVFAKGILVKQMENMRYGYDLSTLTLNRDRSMVDEWDVRNNVVSLISEQYRLRNLTLDDIHAMFIDNNWEAQSGYAWMYTSVIKDLIEHLTKKVSIFSPRGIVFTASSDEATKIESFGWTAIRIHKNLADATDNWLTSDKDTYASFRKSIGVSTFAEMCNQMRDAVEITYSLSDLSDGEIASLNFACACMDKAGIDYPAPSIVKFVRENELLGLYKGGEIFLSRNILTDKHETLATLIHEYSHKFGGDASLAHASAIENTWTKIARQMM